MLSVPSKDCPESGLFQCSEEVQDLIFVFNACFDASENTRLVRGNEEPIYLPWGHQGVSFAQVVFAHGYFASALHEIAHWCIAGRQRRHKIDYDYWYESDGRSLEDQARFAAVEAKPQAIEWIFSVACGKKFNISLDNLSVDHSQFGDFRMAVWQQAITLQMQGLPERAERFRQALVHTYNTESDLKKYDLDLKQL